MRKNVNRNEVEQLEKRLSDAQTKAQQTSGFQVQQVAPPTDIVAKVRKRLFI